MAPGRPVLWPGQALSGLSQWLLELHTHLSEVCGPAYPVRISVLISSIRIWKLKILWVRFIFDDRKGVKDVHSGEIAYYKTCHCFEV
jgi:hypothetical protein